MNDLKADNKQVVMPRTSSLTLRLAGQRLQVNPSRIVCSNQRVHQE